MTTQQQYIERLKDMVAQKLGRRIASADDCSMLSDAVREATGMQLDANDYYGLFFPKSNIAPRPVVLSALTRYVGYDSWSTFCSSSDVRPAEDSDVIPTPRRWGVFILTFIAVVVVIVTAVALLGGGKERVVVLENADVVVEMVEERWLARTLEECNALRAYSGDDDYTERIDTFMEKYTTTLYDEVASELISALDRYGITLEKEKVDSYAETIMAQCYTMCETLYVEDSLMQ